jgi:AraC-like DNA-binding protein/RimJ/RimL family protein N-acetyltransferase
MDLDELVRQVDHHLRATGDGQRQSVEPMNGLVLLRQDRPSSFEASLYEPVLCLILQGRKEVSIGGQIVSVGPGECLPISHELPVRSRITIAPYLALADSPADAKVLCPLISKEIHYRLLNAPFGGMLRSLIRHDSTASAIARAISHIRGNVCLPMTVPDLARRAGMSASAFHQHFKTITSTTPLQYLKELRLLEARRLLTNGGSSVSSAAYEVGYESPSQFSREYTCKFGVPPGHDMVRAAGYARLFVLCYHREVNTTIVKARKKHLKACAEAVRDSELGRFYFEPDDDLTAYLADGMKHEQFFVAKGNGGECQGFIWFVLNGAFHAFPYLHMIAVRKEFRGEGVGTQLIDFVERTVFADHSKVFLVVADFNPDARRLYERLGYEKVGDIPGLYREDVTEHLMMKLRE